MDKQKKTLKKPYSAFCDELKAKAAGEAQKSLAREILPSIEYAIIQARDCQESQIALEGKLVELKKLLHDFLKKPE